MAPSDFHSVHLEAWGDAFPEAETLICPGLEAKKGLRFSALLGDEPPAAWKGQFHQVAIDYQWGNYGRALAKFEWWAFE